MVNIQNIIANKIIKKKKKKYQEGISQKTEEAKKPVQPQNVKKTEYGDLVQTDEPKSYGSGKREINFKKDGTVTERSAGGKVDSYTKDEYKDVSRQLGGGSLVGGKLTENVKQGVETVERNRQILAGQQQGVNGGVSNQQSGANIPLNDTQAGEIPGMLDRIPTRRPAGEVIGEVFDFSPEQVAKEAELRMTDPQAYADLKAERIQAAAAIPLGALGTAIDGIGSIAGLKLSRSKKTQDFIDQFGRQEGIINDKIQAYKSGLISYAEMKRDLQIALESIQSLQQNSKKEGMLNLRYWLDNGLSLDSQINEEIEAYNSLVREIEVFNQQQQAFNQANTLR